MKPGTRPERVGLSEATLSKETSFKGKALQAVIDSWCKIQVLILTKRGLMSMVMSEGGLRFV